MASTGTVDFDALSVSEQILHVQDLWDRIAARAEPGPSLSEPWCAELDRRMAFADANPDAGASWEVVRARVRRR